MFEVESCQNCKTLKRVGNPCTTCGKTEVEEFITLEAYLGSHVHNPEYKHELTTEHMINAKELLLKINSMIREIKAVKPEFEFTVTSGWRPAAYNVKIGGSLRSRHIICQAIDFNDPEGELAKYVCLNKHLLESRGLAIESPRYTAKKSGARWLHLQFPPPRSGRTVYIPYAGKPPLSAEEFQEIPNGVILLKLA